jgi:hypothetical protein
MESRQETIRLPPGSSFRRVARRESVMAKAGISIGDDTPTGEPQNGPKGPYIDDDTDDALARPRGGQDPTRTRPGGSRTETKIARESAIGSDTEGGRPEGGSDTAKPDMPDELAKRPKGPAQP